MLTVPGSFGKMSLCRKSSKEMVVEQPQKHEVIKQDEHQSMQASSKVVLLLE